MSERFFVETPITGDRVTLTGTEAHHLIHVMRARLGTPVVLFDGSGGEFSAVVEGLSRRQVDLQILARVEVDRELTREIVLGVAIPKGIRQKYLVEKVVELGVKCLVPLRTERAVAQPGSATLKRMRHGVIEASKQCGRNRLMEVAPPQDWADFIEATHQENCRLLAHPPENSPLRAPRSGRGEGTIEIGANTPSRIILAVGPEGGLTDAEVALAVAAGWRTVSLGRRILRVETAALLLTAWVMNNCPLPTDH
jgi:16S rRNA (uracil1498-N3)-methyltransferase